MKPPDGLPRQERHQTDESLRVERQSTPASTRAAEEIANVVVERARGTADAVLSAARAKADRKLDETAEARTARESLVAERAAEDETLERERATADEALRKERRVNARALALLLPLEHQRTDRDLATERARFNDALANRDDFLGIVTHDLRHLLAGIAINAMVFRRTALDTEEGRQMAAGAERIELYVARMNRLIGDLVDVASIEAGKLRVSVSPGDLRTLVGEAVQLFQTAASEKGVALQGDVPMELGATFDHGRMLQVLANLVSNALKFTACGGTIDICIEPAGNEIRFSVRDDGAGIAADMLERVFERFGQVGKDDRTGLGLGLYISRCIVEAHGGRIWAESRIGEGSRFSFTLPRERSRASEWGFWAGSCYTIGLAR
jgi:signal transduction histidine kinase